MPSRLRPPSSEAASLVLRDIRQRELAQLERILALQQAQEQARELARQVAAKLREPR